MSHDPHHAEPHNNLGSILLKQGRFTEAAASFHAAVQINPRFASAHFNLGLACQDQGKLTEALACYFEAVRLNPNHAEAFYVLGTTLVALNRFGEGAECFRHALRINPAFLNGHLNYANTLQLQGRFAEADACYGQVLDADPNHRPARWNRACLRLRQGDFLSAWPDFEQRGAVNDTAPRQFEQPRWDGSWLAGKTLLVHAEFGLGDTIQFVRYLPLVRERGCRVLLECQPALLQLLTSANGADQVVRAGASLPDFDMHIPLMSLPGIFATTLDNIPSESPYLKADAKLIEHWRGEIGRAARRKPAGDDAEARKPFLVGIVWQGSMKQKNESRSGRSIPLNHFAPLARLAEVQLVSLQVGPATEQIVRAPFPIIDLGNRFDPNALDDLAAAIMNMDLVLSVDTAAAHLAGALGAPVWTLLPCPACWLYLLDRTDSPWYPTMCLFRQHQSGDWDTVFKSVVQEISGLLT